ncbi:AP-5 complex subunit beta-1-like isoform X1 [Periplaneta americana]|uniref:AP-5 complex subunit beta-1-like isoform X1 n=1 Tax=Periplaneta americana TaxID=6978 RepID=UPI0037E8E9C1
MTSEVGVEDLSCVNANLISLSLGCLTENIDSYSNLLDQLLKVLLEEKDSDKFVLKENVAIFIELEAASLVSSVADIELVFATFKNVFQDCAKENTPFLQGQCLVSMTTVLLQAFEKISEEELTVLFTEHVEFLLGLVKQTNNLNNVHVRSIAASCLTEIELCFPKILRDCVDNMYTAAVAETSVAHQQYMSLLALVIKHTVAANMKETSLWGKYPNAQWKGSFIPQEIDSPVIGYPELKEMVSFLVDQLPLCSTEAVAWISLQIVDMMLHRPDLQASAPVLKPLVLHFCSTYSTLAAHIVLLLEKHLGRILFQEKDHIQFLQQLLLNSSHPALSAHIRLLYLDWLNNYLVRQPEKMAKIQNAQLLLPSTFDGPETHLKKLKLLSSLLRSKQDSSKLLVHALASLQKQLKFGSSIKLKAVLIKVLYTFLCDHMTPHMSTEIPRILVVVTTDDVSFTPFVLNFIQTVQDTLPVSPVPSQLLSMLVVTFTQPDSSATLATFHYVLDVFLLAITQDLSICQPKAILNYLMKYVVCEEVCGLLTWSLGHKILSLCYKLMSNYDTVEFFHDFVTELCEVLKNIMSNCDDVDLLDRAQIYHSLLVSLSNRKLKEVLVSPQQSLTSIMANESSFHSSSSICTLNEPILQLKKQRNVSHSIDQMAAEIIVDIPEDILKLHTRHLSFVSQKPLVIKGRLDTTSKFDTNLKTLQALAIFFTASESWGRIEPIMIGHYSKSVSPDDSEPAHIVDIECFLYKPYPAVVQVCADFSIRSVCYVCTLEPLKLDLPDFFQPLPVHDEFISSPTAWRRSLFSSLWTSLEERSQTVNNVAFTSVCVLQQRKEDVREKLFEEMGPYIIQDLKDDDIVHVGIYLSPVNHLLMKFLLKEDYTLVRMVTDDVHVLAHVNSYLKSWQAV